MMSVITIALSKWSFSNALNLNLNS